MTHDPKDEICGLCNRRQLYHETSTQKMFCRFKPTGWFCLDTHPCRLKKMEDHQRKRNS